MTLTNLAHPNKISSPSRITSYNVCYTKLLRDRAYVTGIADSKKDSSWYIYRKGKPLVDPDTEQTLGFEALFLGTARQVGTGDPATVELTTSTEEIGTGDKLIPVGKPEIVDYIP